MRGMVVSCLVVLLTVISPVSALGEPSSGSVDFAPASRDPGPSPHFSSRDLRRLAPIQVVVPTAGADTLEVLGSRDGVEWRHLGVFEVQVGEVPSSGLGTPSGQVSYALVGGTLTLEGGSSIQRIIASVADVGIGSDLLPTNAFTFVVHEIGTSDGETRSRIGELSLEAAAVPGLRVLGHEDDPGVEPSGPRQYVTGNAGTCEQACQSAMEAKLQICSSSYATCVAAATAALSLCLAVCPPTGLGCAACAAAYAAALFVCDQDYESCKATARIDKGACDASCSVEPEEPFCPTEDPICTPLVLNVDGRHDFRFTSATDGVWFDLDGDGALQRTAWTQSGHEQAFLVLDRNGNGYVDDGLELFGGVTRQPVSDNPNGFRALEVFDDPQAGGNGDGLISGDDSVFSVLRLWFDENQDGFSQPAELRGLAEEGVVSIDTDYRISSRRDSHGNLLRYSSRVWLGDRSSQCVDVFFLQGGP